MKEKFSRRDFLKLSAVGAASLAGGSLLASILACGGSAPDVMPTATQTPRVFELNNYDSFEIGSDVPPEIAFLSMATRYRPEQFNLITNPLHRDILARIYLENAKVARSGFANMVDEAILDGNACGLVGCGDSRVNYPKIFPNIPTAVGELDASGNIVGIPTYRVGSQPAIFPKGTNISVFAPHQIGECLPGGCGALGGIETLINSPDGVSQLMKHGVSQITIDELNRLIKLGAGTNAEDWARIGAQIQAEINTFASGNPHYAAYGIYGHADDSFKVLGVVDNLGYTHPIDDFPKLKAVTSYMNQPHPIIEELAKGQEPMIIGINGSRNHTIPGLFGDLTDESGLLFKSDVDKIPGLPVSAADARQVIAGADYGINVLKNKNFIVLVADNADDMAILRTTLLNEGVEQGSIKAFFDRGGIIVEVMPDKTGKFANIANVRTVDDLLGDAARIDFANSASLRSAISLENTFLGQIELRTLRDFELGIISEANKSKILRMITFLRNPALRPVGLFLKLGLQFIGDYYAIKGFVEWFNNSLLDENLVFENSADNVVWRDKTVMTSEEQMSLMVNNGIAQPYLADGRIDNVFVKQTDLVKAHAGAVRAWLKHGKGGGEGEYEPWNLLDIKDLGKLVTLKIPSANPYDAPITLITTLVSKPNDDKLDGFEPEYNSENPNQLMMLVDQATETSIPILGDVPGQNTTVAAIDPNNPKVRYYFNVISVPEKKQFEFRLVGLGCNAPESAGMPIPVGNEDVFARRDTIPRS